MKNKILAGILAASVCVNGFVGSAIVYADKSSDFGAADIQHDNRTAYLERYGEYFDIFHCVADFSDGKTVYSYLVKEKSDVDNIVPEDGFELTNVKELANNELYYIIKPDKMEEYFAKLADDSEEKAFMTTLIVRDENNDHTSYYSVSSREEAKAKAAELGLSEGEYEIEEKWAGGAPSFIIEPKLYGDIRTVQYLDENYNVLNTVNVSGEQFAYNIEEGTGHVRFVSKTEGAQDEDHSGYGLGALADNSVTESCVFIRIISVNNIDFLKQYKDSLIENGVSEADAEAMKRKLNGEINVDGLIVSDPELEKSRQEFFAEKIDKEIDNICATIGIDRNDVTVTRKDMCHIIRGNLTKMQISNAEKLRYYPIITVGEEIEKYKGKIANPLLLTWIREGRDEYHVNVRVKAPESDMTEKACADYFKELLGVDSPENIGAYKAKYLGCDIEYTDCLSAEATVNAKQLEKICVTGEVMEVSAIPEGYMQSTNPTDPVVPSVPAEKTTGDINNDYLIDITDLTMLSIALVGDNELTAEQMTSADIDGDGEVTLADLARLRQYLSKKIVSLDDTSAPAPDAYNFKDHYIRIQSVINGETPQKYMFETASDFRSFLEKNEEMVTQSKQHPSEMNLEDAQKKYDDKWFENHDLIMVLLQEGSGSIRHSVTSIDTQMIKIMQRIPELGTADMAGWAILIELNKGSKIDINNVKVVLNEEMACSTTE